MNMETLRKTFIDAGYREYPASDGGRDYVTAFFQKMLRPEDLPLGVSGCIANEGKLFFNVYVWELYNGHNVYLDVEVSILASYCEDRWVHIKHIQHCVTSIADLEQIERRLIAAWEMVNG